MKSSDSIISSSSNVVRENCYLFQRLGSLKSCPAYETAVASSNSLSMYVAGIGTLMHHAIASFDHGALCAYSRNFEWGISW
jgi:hypothetical protein